MVLAFAIILSTSLFFLIRTYPYARSRHQACDSYYFLLCIEYFKKTKKLPITLPPYYLMEYEEQSYPPGFSVFCSLLSDGFLQKTYWLINHILEYATAMIAFFLTYEITGQSWAAFAAVLFYAVQPGILHELQSLTSRCLAVFLFHCFVLSVYCTIYVDPYFAIASVISGSVLIYTHKLTMQVLWMVMPFMTLFTGHWQWIGLLLMSYFVSAAVYPSLFFKIQRHHWDMIMFWSKYWPDMGKHQIYDSPLYYDGKKRQKFYGKEGLSSWSLYARRLLFENAFIVPSLIMLFYASALSAEAQTLLYLQISVFIAAILVIYVPALRGIGSGWQYVKYGVMPTSVFMAYIATEPGFSWLYPLYAVFFLYTLYQYMSVSSAMRKRPVDKIEQEDDFENLVYAVKSLPETSRFLCFPLHMCDALVYKARRAVLWGSHSYPFSRIDGFFPVLRKPISVFVKEYNASHAIIDENYVSPAAIGIKGDPACVCGRYKIYDLNDVRNFS